MKWSFYWSPGTKAKKNNAIHVKKLSANVRPERLMRKQMSSSSHINVQIVHQPKGPDGSKGFVPRRIQKVSNIPSSTSSSLTLLQEQNSSSSNSISSRVWLQGNCTKKNKSLLSYRDLYYCT